MQEKEFNLLDEPWIKVLTSDMEEKEVSLVDALIHAHEYKALSGEMPTQDFAILRLLLACMITIFYRYDADGNGNAIDEWWDEEDVLSRWKEYWDRGSFSEQSIKDYLYRYYERFWLFHPETPFYQVADLEYGTDYGIQGLYGNLKSSNNPKTKYHFSLYEGQNMQSTSYSEAARWLIHLNGFCINVKSDKKAPGSTVAAGVGRLGRLGLIYVDGKNLFDMLMMNLTPLDPSKEIWGKPTPIWEQPVHTEQSVEVPPPDNLPELYTLQSRRIMLKRDDRAVSGIRVLNGDHYPFENDFTEPMTIWRKIEDKKSHRIDYLPQKHSSEIQAWREFSAILNKERSGHIPGIIMWVGQLRNNNCLSSKGLVTLKIIGMEYGDGMSYTLGNCLSDGMTLSINFLEEFSQEWITRITDEIDKCGRVISEGVLPFVRKIGVVVNDSDKSQDARKKLLTESFYSEIDIPFRDWLYSIDPQINKKEEIMEKWEIIVSRCALKVVREYIEDMNQDAYKMRGVDGQIISIPQAYSDFIRAIWSIYPAAREKTRKENIYARQEK